jgi:hypothetical protein
MAQKAIVIAQKGRKIIFETEPFLSITLHYIKKILGKK